MARHGNRVIGDYIVTQQIGAGSFAVVWKARHKQQPGLHVAIKEIATERLNKKLQDSLRSEIAILRRTDHPNIIRLHDIVEAPNRIYLVLEYCAGGDLAAYIQRYGKVSEVVARHFMRQLGAGLQVLRNNNLIHRDLKPQNLLLSTNDSHAVLKIADFGFARSLQPQGMAETLCGSPLYMAPEILQSKKYDAKADLWSVGAILFQLVTGRPPFSGNNHVQLLQNIIKSSEVRFPDPLMAQLHPDCIDMCRKLLRRNPVERLSFEEFFNHNFMGVMRPKSERSDDTQAATSNSGATSEASETSQEDCFPIILDDEQQEVVDGGVPSSKPPLFSPSPSSSLLLPPSGRKTSLGSSPPTRMGLPSRERHDDRPRGQGLLEFENVATMREADFGPYHTGSSMKGALGDSIETIEREYVLVTAPLTSTENLTMSLSASGVTQYPGKGASGSPQKTSHLGTTNSGGGGVSGGSNDSNPSQSSQDLGGDNCEGPSLHPPTRLSSLQRCARMITELATEKMEAGQGLESFSIQLVCLAVWKEALRVCQTWAVTVGDHEGLGSNKEQDISTEAARSEETSAANACSLMEREFAFAVERAESLVSQLNVVDACTEMPDAIELIFQAALAVGRAGAVEELMGNVTNAAVAYAKAAALLYFLVVEAAALPLQPPLLLSPIDRSRADEWGVMAACHCYVVGAIFHEWVTRHRLRRYADGVTARQHQCTVSAQARQTFMAKGLGARGL